MKVRLWKRYLTTAVGFGLLLGACAQQPASPAPTEAPAVPTPTALPPTPVPTDTPTPEPSDSAWDYVVLGDSDAGGQGAPLGKGYADVYAGYIEQDLGVDVTVYNRAIAGSTTGGLLSQLRNDDEVRTLISEAEIITIWTGFNDIYRLFYDYGTLSPKCGSARDADMDCIHTEVRAMEENFDAILAEIVTLRSPNEALILIGDGCNFFVQWWQQAGLLEELKGPGFEEWSTAIGELAAKHSVIVVHTYHTCNGPEGDEPIPADLLVPSEWFHFNEAGHKMIADLHRAAGYEHGQ